jgi:hypothetical protein
MSDALDAPGPQSLIKAVGAAVILADAAAPIVMLALWRGPAFRPVLLAVCRFVAVGCLMHAVIDAAQRMLSLTGQLQIPRRRPSALDSRSAARGPSRPVLLPINAAVRKAIAKQNGDTVTVQLIERLQR